MSKSSDPFAITRPMPARAREDDGSKADPRLVETGADRDLLTTSDVDRLTLSPNSLTLEPLPPIIADRYAAMAVLGSGATATVYEVEDAQTGQHLALKVLDLEDETARARFRREISALKKLQHPAIVPILDDGVWEDHHYMVMELVDGPNLLDWIKASDGPMDYARAARLFGDVAHALHEAHAAGIVHRDVKHGNLLLQTLPDGTERLRVLDFGLAKAVNSGSSLTNAGTVVGSPAFMCPERLFAGATASPAWDVYSLGVVMYEVITRKPLFRGGSWAEVMNLIRNRMPDFVSTIRPDAPPVLDWLIAEMLAKEPYRRPSGCDVVARRLERIGEQLAE